MASTDVGDDDTWSDTSDEDEHATLSPRPIESRTYQIEMFEHSMKGNIIAVMGTGSGKTQVAKLRIEAELQRTPGKRIWFTAPSLVLADQQFKFLSKQLPSAQFKLITGMNSPEHWTTRELWNKALHNIDVIVCTPQTLLNALDGGFVSMTSISLLVVDEAHHCVNNDPSKVIMQNHYRSSQAEDIPRPCILGLTASPVTKKSTTEMGQLENNLDSKCISPSQEVEGYTSFLNVAKLNVVNFAQSSHQLPRPLIVLTEIVERIRVDDDPFAQNLRGRKDLRSQEKLKKIISKNRTPSMDDLRSFATSATNLQEALGPWATCRFIAACLHKVQRSSSQALEFLSTPPSDSIRFINRSLQPLHELMLSQPDSYVTDGCSSKVDTLCKILSQEHSSTTRALVFVKTRSTAWALTSIIKARSMQQYRPFSFVGCSIPAHQSAFEFAQLHVQHDNLEKFRSGELNLCIATSVMEEGVDVPAMNLVVCFDEPSNLRSFIQSRGRARQQDSKFILLREENDPSRKLDKWHAVEEDMKLECADETRNLERRRANENQFEQGGEVFRVASTGATLTYENSPQLLESFCAKISTARKSELSTPVYVFTESDGAIRTTVHLPSTLDPGIQIVRSASAWRTEKMAKRDAAFQAYKLLYTSGLLTEHLRADVKEDDDIDGEDGTQARSVEKRESDYAVQRQYDPWPMVLENLLQTPTLYAHQIKPRGVGRVYPAMALILPFKIDYFEFSLHLSASDHIQVSVSATREEQSHHLGNLRKTSYELLSVIWGRRLNGVQAERLPLFLVPDLSPEILSAWHERNLTGNPLTLRILNGDLGQHEYLLRNASTNVPYLFGPQGYCHKATSIEDLSMMTLEATRLSRRLDFLSASNAAVPQKPAVQATLAAGECQLLDLPVEYADFMLLVPSMTHMFEIALRSMQACRGPLLPLKFHNLDLVSEALTLPAVSTKNYQRLEFLGDDLLKYHTSVQLFVDYPYHPESMLSLYRDRLVTNARLYRATLKLGLDTFLTREKYNVHRWAAGAAKDEQSDGKRAKQALSSKVLADVIEALIGAAYVDGTKQGNSEMRAIAALQLFIEEVDWETPADKLARLNHASKTTALHRLDLVERMIDYSFTRPHLLAEALTHSSYQADVLSYERLEFLGDAVLDHIVKLKMYHSEHSFDPDQMTLRRHALVAHATLAFFALQISHVSTTTDLETVVSSQRITERETQRVVYLPDHVRQVNSLQIARSREGTLDALSHIEDTILTAFEYGRKFPWAELLHINAPKLYSDVLESVVGAVFVDSGGDINACERVLDNIGYMKLLNRLSREKDFDASHPEQSLNRMPLESELVSQERKTSGWRCKVLVDGGRVAHFKRATCREEAECRAAERALQVLSGKMKE